MNRFLTGLALVGVWAFFLAVETAGIDYGLHWDEDKIIQTIRSSVQNQSILPNSYLYPSLVHNVGLLALAGIEISTRGERGSAQQSLTARLLEIAGSKRFLLRLRTLTSVAASLAIFWVFGAAWFVRRNVWDGLMAASFLAFSWEFSYHARWFTVDPWLMQFGAMTLFFLSGSGQSRHPFRWILCAAASAGLATGSKHTGIFFLPPALLAGLHFCREMKIGRNAQKPGGDGTLPGPMAAVAGLIRDCLSGQKYLWMLLGVFASLLLLSTPGIALQFKAFFRDALFQIQTYGHWGNDAYTVGRGPDHLSRMAQYLVFAAFSKFPALSVAIFLLAVAGGRDLWMTHRAFARNFMVYPGILLAFFSFQIVMVARNLLGLFPFMALLAGRGAVSLFQRARRWPLARAVFLGGIISGLLSNACWMAYAAWTIRNRESIQPGKLLSLYLDAHPRTRFQLSSTAAQSLLTADARSRMNAQPISTAPADYLVFSTGEAGKRFDGLWPANRWNYLEKYFGPYEVNWNYYPTWLGDFRLVIMKKERGLKLMGPPSRDGHAGQKSKDGHD